MSIIESFLQQRAGAGLSRRRSTRRTAPRPTGGATATPTSTGLTDEFETTLIADPRTQKIIVTTYSQRDLEDINMLVKELDTRFDLRRLRTQIYRMRFLKAIDVEPVIRSVIGAGGGLSGQAGLGTSRSRRSTRGTTSTPRPTPTPLPTAGGGGQGGPLPALIVAHEETNSLIIQAEEEEYQEIRNILEKIDVKRRQVFLEAALVQVQTSSALNFAIELLAGEPDDRDTRALFESSFGLSGIDAENFNRVFPDLTQPPSGALLAFMHRGKFPALIQALKVNQDSQVLATPFILADDNIENSIEIKETRFVVNTNTVNQATTTSQQGEEAGIVLNLIPTISSQDAVLLDVQLEVSEFGQGGTRDVLPPKTSNVITSAVTISDDRIYVVGGLTRQRQDKTVSKVPLLGDIPLLGKLFRSESASKNLTNLYIFLRAHILTDPDFEDLKELSRRAEANLRERHPNIHLTNPAFEDFQSRYVPPPAPDPDRPRIIQQNGEPTESRRSGVEDYYEDYRNDPGGPSERALPPEDARPPIREERRSIGPDLDSGFGAFPETLPEPGPGGFPSTGPERRVPDPPAFWEERGLELDESGESWLIPLKRKETAETLRPRRRTVETGWLGESSPEYGGW